MPKMKTNRGAIKRFKVTGSGQYKRKSANRRHILTKKAQGRKRHLRGNSLVNPADKKTVSRMIHE